MGFSKSEELVRPLIAPRVVFMSEMLSRLKVRLFCFRIFC